MEINAIFRMEKGSVILNYGLLYVNIIICPSGTTGTLHKFARIYL